MAPAPATRRLTSKPATRPALAQFRYQYAGKGTQAQGAFLDRKRLLAEVLRPVKDPVKLSEHLEGDGPAIRRRACELELEAIISERSNARDVSGRSREWLK